MSLKRKKIIAILLAISVFSIISAAIVYVLTPPSSNLLRVVAGSMCVPYDGRCSGRTSPSEPTLHVGDYILFEPVDPRTLRTDYPNSDIIVFKKPTNPDELIVHRIVTVEERNEILYFRTKGDGNGMNKWPNTPFVSEYDPWETDGIPGIREDLIVGKVVNNNVPFLLLTSSFLILIGVSAIAGIGAVLMLVFSLLAQRRNRRIEELEERIRRLEAEKEK